LNYSRRQLFANAAIALREPASALRLRDARCANADASEPVIESNHGAVIHSRETAKDSAAPAPISLRRASPKASDA
jgi:hypothetical protein